MPSEPPKLLLTGATGYVGGTVLNQLFSSEHPALRNLTFTLLVRGEDRAKLLELTHDDRIKCVLFNDFNETDFITTLASKHDIVVNAGSGSHAASAEAMVRGLAKRKAAREAAANGDGASAPLSPPVWMIHTSGCSNISDRPITGQAFPDREWDDADAAAVHAFMTAENARERDPQRAAELAVLDAGARLGVGATSIQAPLVYGQGEGRFRRAGLAVSTVTTYVLDRGYGFAAGEGTGVVDTVHISDLADVYVRCVVDVLARGGAHVPSGRRGIIFPVAGRTLIKDIAQRCVDAAFAAGVLPKENGEGPREREVRLVGLAELATTTAGDRRVAELQWAGHRKTVGTVARRDLGWKPLRGEAEWKMDFDDELQAVLAGRRSVMIDPCVAEGTGPGQVA